jgi:hypothetical protein
VQASRLWFDELSSTLLSEGFEQNPYDQCCFNRDYNGYQQTVIIHVDDLFCSCKDNRANVALVKSLEKRYSALGVQTGTVHSYLGMTFDFSIQGMVKVTQEGYITELLDSEEIKSSVKTPASPDLHELDLASPELNKTDKEHFHSVVAKLLYLSKRTRPDILVAISFLTSRVLVATDQDATKLMRVLKYLNGTRHMGIILSAEEAVLSLKIYIDASYGVHADGKSHTGSNATLGNANITAKSTKQKLVAKSSTEAELIAASDSVSTAIHCRNFLEAQGYKLPPVTVFQDNMSTIAMIRAGKPTSDRTRHVNIRFFFLHDRENLGEIKVEYLPTKQMLADVLTKPLQGDLFLSLRDQLLNWTSN